MLVPDMADHLLLVLLPATSVFAHDTEREAMQQTRSDVLQGTLDLMVLKTLDVMGSMHGYALARRIEQISEDAVSLNQGTIYPALLRLQQCGWISAEWGVSDSNRRAKFYTITRSGKKQLILETRSWEKVAVTMARILGSSRPTP
jgi:PadR family transcriptional regulator PadR